MVVVNENGGYEVGVNGNENDMETKGWEGYYLTPYKEWGFHSIHLQCVMTNRSFSGIVLIVRYH